MALNSYLFIFLFLPLAAAGYWLLTRYAGRGFALAWLLVMSVVFYGYSGIKNAAIIAPSILLDFAIARALLRTNVRQQRVRTILFGVSIAANVALLATLKYKNFFLETTNALFATHYDLAPLILPLGISFLTFQKIAFISDVNSGKIREITFFDFVQFLLFFPRVIAGPIVYYKEIVPQFRQTQSSAALSNIVVGLLLFSIGLFKKSAIADSVGAFVPEAFDIKSESPPGMLVAWIGLLACTFQTYFDFSGYSDMALGAARMFGVRLPANFNSPFKSSSVSEFWCRWHMTLTRFLTAYIYTPIFLGVSRMRAARRKPVLRGKDSSLGAIVSLICLPTLITMLIAGVWHGAGWQFIIFGLLHAAYLMVNQVWRTVRPRFWQNDILYDRIMRPLGVVLTFCAVVFAFVFFRAPSVAAAWSILGSLSGANGLFPRDVQLLQGLGVQFHWDYLGLLGNPYLPQPGVPIAWLVALFAGVALLPNSLEILERYGPALDFPAVVPQARRVPPQSSDNAQSGKEAKELSIVKGLMAGRSWFLGGRGPWFAKVVSLLAAILFILGIAASGRGHPFVYGQF